MVLDCRGKFCPEPVIMTKDKLDSIEFGIVSVLVDNKASCTNVQYFAENEGHNVTVVDKDGYWQLDIIKGDTVIVEEEEDRTDEKVCLHIACESMGSEDMVLGKKLMMGFLGNIKNISPKPQTIIFVNTGIKMTTVNKDSVAVLKELEKDGAEVLSCGVCLEHFGLVDELKVGRVSDAHTVMLRMFGADKLIRI